MSDKSELMVRMWAVAQPVVAAYISAGVRNYADAQDVLQEVAVAVFSSNAPLTSENEFLAWSMGVARHKIAYYFRQKSRAPALLDDSMLASVAEAFVRQPDAWSGQSEAFEQCVQGVKGEARRLLEMRYKEGRTLEEIAQAVGRPGGTVRVALHRIRGALRECIERRLGMAGGGEAGV